MLAVSENRNISIEGPFSMGFYFRALSGLLASPGRFFQGLPETVPVRWSLGFLTVSSLFFTGASLTLLDNRVVLMMGILFVNAVTMPLIAACFSFMAMIMIVGRRIPFSKLYALQAFSSGTTMLISWVPMLVILTEPWKWFLLAKGLVKAGGLSWVQAILIAGISFCALALFFWSFAPMILYLRSMWA